ncbi:MAG: Gfo/Idh/MocA family oxidoreductase [Minicystis sp.]
MAGPRSGPADSSFDDHPVLDVEIDPAVTFALRSRTWDLSAGYAPRLVLHAPGAAPDVAHVARVGATWHDWIASLSLSQEGSWGRWSFGALTPAPDASPAQPHLGALPAASVLDVVFARTAVLARVAAPRRWTWSFLAEHTQSGGVDAAARALVPFQAGPHGQLGLDHALSRRDHVAVTLDASRATFSSGPEVTLLQAGLSWRRALSRATDGTISGGAAWTLWRAGDTARAAIHPIAEASLTHRILAGRLDAQLTARMGPVVDALSGIVDERVEGSGSVSFHATRSLTVQGRIRGRAIDVVERPRRPRARPLRGHRFVPAERRPHDRRRSARRRERALARRADVPVGRLRGRDDHRAAGDVLSARLTGRAVASRRSPARTGAAARHDGSRPVVYLLPAMERPIRWGILGTGVIAARFAEGLRALPDARLAAVGSRRRDAAEAFARHHGAARAHASYAGLVADREVDVVYVATPNTRHAEDTILALDHGKPVLCEKPFAMHAAEARAVVAVARARRLFVMEAMWMRFVPAVRELQALVRDGAIGDPRMVSAHLGASLAFDATHRVFAAALGGGALLDLGVYPISLAFMLLGRPTAVTAQAVRGETGIDEQATMLLTFAGGRQAVLSTSFRNRTEDAATVMGTEGMIRVHEPLYCPEALTVMRSPPRPAAPPEPRSRLAARIARLAPVRLARDLYRRATHTRITRRPLGGGYAHQAAEVMRCLRAGELESPIMPLDETVAVLAAMDAMRAQWEAAPGALASAGGAR